MYSIVIPVFIVLCGVALLLNSLMILILRRTRVRNAVVTLILSLTLSDMWTSSIVAVSLLYNSYLPNVEGTTVNPCVSLTLENLRTAGLLTGIFHLLLIAINHYVSIIRPHISKKRLKRMASIPCIFAWISPIFALVSLSLAFDNQGYYDDCIRVDFYSSRIFRTTLSGVLAVIFMIIICCYTRIVGLKQLGSFNHSVSALRPQRTEFESKAQVNAEKLQQSSLDSHSHLFELFPWVGTSCGCFSLNLFRMWFDYNPTIQDHFCRVLRSALLSHRQVPVQSNCLHSSNTRGQFGGSPASKKMCEENRPSLRVSSSFYIFQY